MSAVPGHGVRDRAASYNVEEFGTERVARLRAEEIGERVAELARITRFIEKPSRSGLRGSRWPARGPREVRVPTTRGDFSSASGYDPACSPGCSRSSSPQGPVDRARSRGLGAVPRKDRTTRRPTTTTAASAGPTRTATVVRSVRSSPSAGRAAWRPGPPPRPASGTARARAEPTAAERAARFALTGGTRGDRAATKRRALATPVDDGHLGALGRDDPAARQGWTHHDRSLGPGTRSAGQHRPAPR